MKRMTSLRQWAINKLSTPETSITLEDEIISETEMLERDIVNKELDRIDLEYKIKGQRAKRNYLLSWLSRDVPAPIHHVKSSSTINVGPTID